MCVYLSLCSLWGASSCLYCFLWCKSSEKLWGVQSLFVRIFIVKMLAPGFAVKLGLQPGFNVNSKAKAKGNGGSVEADIDAKTVDLSIPIGLSYEFSNFVIDGRYNWGVTKVAKDSDSKNSVFQITLGYKLPL